MVKAREGIKSVVCFSPCLNSIRCTNCFAFVSKQRRVVKNSLMNLQKPTIANVALYFIIKQRTHKNRKRNSSIEQSQGYK